MAISARQTLEKTENGKNNEIKSLVLHLWFSKLA